MGKTVLTNGIDVSFANGVISWTVMKGKIDFAILRCGYGSDFTSQDDAQWENNVKGCEQNGIPYGVYLYSYATTAEKAKSEAAHVIRLLKGHRPAYPVFLDLEETAIASLGKTKILELAKIFCTTIENAGYPYGTYANKSWFTSYLTDAWYDTHPKWIAQYNATVTYPGSYDIWQYTSSGVIDGFTVKFDCNRCYTSFLKGDVDGDGKVTAQDARKILRAASQLETLTAEESARADVDGDGKITAEDARAALRESAGIG